MADDLCKAPPLPDVRKGELLLFQQGAGLEFRDLSLLDMALTHSSYANERRDPATKDNERLEFLGDSILEAASSDYLYRRYGFNEGDSTRIRSAVVSEDALARIALDLGIDRWIRLGRGEEATGGRHKKAILADCVEAVFAACYLDRGFEWAKCYIQKLLAPAIEAAIEGHKTKDYKTLLQEHIQKRLHQIPVYKLVNETGPAHDRRFYTTVAFAGRMFGPAEGHTKKEAELGAAELAYKSLGLDKRGS